MTHSSDKQRPNSQKIEARPDLHQESVSDQRLTADAQDNAEPEQITISRHTELNAAKSITNTTHAQPVPAALDIADADKGAASVAASDPQKKATTKQSKANKRMRTTDRHGSTLFWVDFKWLVFLMTVGAIVGEYFGYLERGIIVGMIFYYVWRQYAVQQFYGWMSRSLTLPPPDFSGSLTYMANQLYESKKQEQLTHQKMMGLVKKIRSSLLALQDAVIILDQNDSLEWWNQSAERLLELRSEDQGRSILELIDVPEFQDYYQVAVSPNEGVRLRSWKHPERFLQCEVTHFGHEKLLIIYDVTRLQHLEQMRKDFVGNVSHELRTPLTVLMGYIETFSDQPDLDPKWKRGFSLMTQQTNRMNHIINDLLLLSRLENEETTTMTCIDMSRLLSSIFDDAQAYNREYGHMIHLRIDSQKSIYGSEMYLYSALLNLVTNAIKYTPKGGEIDISWQDKKDGALFSVHDNGIGIPQEHIHRLTERFYRVDSGRSRATGGTGLGLAIVKHVLYQHEAKLTIESSEGKGSTFNVLFPARCIYDGNEKVKTKQSLKKTTV